ncbi:MAG: hypothetical protein ACTFAL_15930 [Candidatus Electronema sp. V4]|uniref:hypothetical protein n=1 Tax=Candidatus Electronema sp. V4 TaxID=3454756 RepID=UPI0040556CC5
MLKALSASIGDLIRHRHRQQVNFLLVSKSRRSDRDGQKERGGGKMLNRLSHSRILFGESANGQWLKSGSVLRLPAKLL